MEIEVPSRLVEARQRAVEAIRQSPGFASIHFDYYDVLFDVMCESTALALYTWPSSRLTPLADGWIPLPSALVVRIITRDDAQPDPSFPVLIAYDAAARLLMQQRMLASHGESYPCSDYGVGLAGDSNYISPAGVVKDSREVEVFLGHRTVSRYQL